MATVARFPWGLVGALGAGFGVLVAAAEGVALVEPVLAIALPALVLGFVPALARAVAARARGDRPALEPVGASSFGALCAGAGVFAGALAPSAHYAGPLAALRGAGALTALAGLTLMLRALRGDDGGAVRSVRERVLREAFALGPPAAVLLTGAVLAPRAPAAPAVAGLALLLGALGVAASQALREPSPEPRARWGWVAGGLGVVVACLGPWLALSPAASSAGLARALLAWGLMGGAVLSALAVDGVALASVRGTLRTLVLAAGLAGLGTALGALRSDPLAAGALGAAGALLGAALARAARFERSERYLEGACERAAVGAAGAQRLDELAAALLGPLREAHGDAQANAALWLPDAGRRLVLDVAGGVRDHEGGFVGERALLAWLRARRDEVLLTEALRPRVVRRTELRAVVDALDAQGALAAVPLVEPETGALAAVLLVPSGRRRALLRAGELHALRALAASASRALARVLALDEALRRARAAEQREQVARDEVSRAEERAARAQAQLARAVQVPASMAAQWVGYSDAMRSLDEALARVAAEGSAPVLLRAEPGCAVAAVALRLHGYSSRAGGPCVLLDASGLHPREAAAELEGDGVRPGWLEVARGGTLLVEDAAALPVDASEALLRVLRGERGDEAPRLVLSLRGPLAGSGLPAELCARVGDRALELPPLRARDEDLEPLVLLALDRGCRLVGRAPLGVSREALAAVRAYPWPGNERELRDAFERAAHRARGERVALDDLPPAVAALAPAGARPRVPGAEATHDDDSLLTYDALERRILEDALERAGGNKSIAARALGLARTTFLDKLRKYGLRA